MYAKSARDYPFEAIPKADSIEYRIEDVGQHTVVAVLWVSVMKGMVAWGLDQAHTLKQRDYWAVFCRRAMCPFVNLVGVDSEYDHQPGLPRKPTADPGHPQHHEAQTQEQPGTLEPPVPREMARFMVMQDVWRRDEPTGNRPILPTICILKPVKQTGQKVRYQQHADKLKNNHKLLKHPDLAASQLAAAAFEATRACRGGVN